MKFYATILTAIVLLGLCVLEKKAKENMPIKVLEDNSRKTFLATAKFDQYTLDEGTKKDSDFYRNTNQNLNLITSISADSSEISLPFLGKTVLHSSLVDMFSAQH